MLNYLLNVTSLKVRNCTDKIKSACAELSVKCNISTQASCIAIQTVCNTLYGHKYYLTKDEAIQNDPSMEMYKTTGPKPSKWVKSAEKSEVPISIHDYAGYKNVLPSPRVLNDHKHVLAIQNEKKAAIALNQIESGIKVTLHFDTISHSKIEGDWPCLILIFSDKHWFPLQPLFFTYEDHAQIIRLIVETYKRFAATINAEEFAISAKLSWEKTASIMTDSVSKTLQIGDGVAEVLQSSHTLHHLLCKSHPVEAFDWSNIHVLADIEKQLDYRNKLQTLNPAVKSFLGGSTCVVECAIASILSLVSHKKSAHSTNQAELFDHILQREQQVKHIAMYYEQQFTKLRYSATSILDLGILDSI